MMGPQPNNMAFYKIISVVLVLLLFFFSVARQLKTRNFDLLALFLAPTWLVFLCLPSVRPLSNPSTAEFNDRTNL